MDINGRLVKVDTSGSLQCSQFLVSFIASYWRIIYVTANQLWSRIKATGIKNKKIIVIFFLLRILILYQNLIK